MTLYYDGYAGAIATLDGTTVTVAACSSAYVPSASDVDLDAIAVGEIDTGDAAGYARQTVTVTWDVAARRLTFDDPIEFDLDGASDVQHFVVADASGDLAFVLSYDTPIEGYDGFTLAPPVAASEADTAGIEARLSALEAAPGPPSPVPDPSTAPDGKVIITDDGGYVLGDPPGGGGGGASTSGEPINATLDDGTEYVADLSGLAASDVSVVVAMDAGATKLTLTLPPPTSGRVLAVTVIGGDATPFQVDVAGLGTASEVAQEGWAATFAVYDLGGLAWSLAGAPWVGSA